MAAGMPERFLFDRKEMMRRKIQDERLKSRKALILKDPKSDRHGSFNEDSETEPEPEPPFPQNTSGF